VLTENRQEFSAEVVQVAFGELVVFHDVVPCQEFFTFDRSVLTHLRDVVHNFFVIM
jgi:hypothetical protein